MPKKTLETIISSGNDYIVQVKKNQKKLYYACKKISEESISISSFESYDKGHGREEIRKTTLFYRDSRISSEWDSINLVIQVERLSKRKTKTSYETSYYVSSLETEDAEEIGLGIRNHWSIENRLHWVKDVIQNEDNSRIKKENGIITLSILKNIAINICRQNGFNSIKYATIYYASNTKKLYEIIRT